MCPNSSNGQHSYVLKAIITDNGTYTVRVCMLCNAEG